MTVARFMSTPTGRTIRAVAGLVLIVLGYFSIGGVTGAVVGIVGFVPVAAAVFNFCLIGPLVGGYFDGRKNLDGASRGRHTGSPQH